MALDGKPIGTHRFGVAGAADARSVDSRADLVVRLLGIPVYRYRHRAEEPWQGECLRGPKSETDDDGQRRQVSEHFDGSPCLMGFAYWNPKLVQQRQLVDPQTGRVTDVRFEAVADSAVEVRGRPVQAHGWRLLADKQRITVWYAADTGRWIGLGCRCQGRAPAQLSHSARGQSPTADGRRSRLAGCRPVLCRIPAWPLGNRHPAIEALGFDEAFKRLWTYCLSYCEAGFKAGRVDVGLYKLRRA